MQFVLSMLIRLSANIQGKRRLTEKWKNMSVRILSVVGQMYFNVLIVCVVESEEMKTGEEQYLAVKLDTITFR